MKFEYEDLTELDKYTTQAVFLKNTLQLMVPLLY